MNSNSLRRIAKRAGLRTALERAGSALGFDVVRRDFYSAIPDWRSAPPATWERPSPMRAIAFDADAGLRLLETELAPHVAEFRPPAERPAGQLRFFYRNAFFQGGDADVLYAMIRRHRPGRVLELGSGYSSLVIGEAAERNRAEGAPCVHEVYDPFARADLRDAIRRRSTLHLTSATDVGLAAFEGLEAGDVLFVDTTHTVKLNSDVNRIVLDLLPVLAPGVLVHFHDVFLPWEYPRSFFADLDVFWAEQYLLQAFLMYNDAWEVLLGVHALLRAHPDRLAAAVPGIAERLHPGSFWLRRRTL